MTTLNDIGPVLVHGRWLNPVRRYRPAVLHSLLGGVRVSKLVVQIAEQMDIPIVPHFMDDWLDTLFADGQLLGVPRREVNRVVYRVLRRAPLCLVIGEDMKREYEERLGIPCEIVGNSVDFGSAAWRGRNPDRKRLTLRYAGGLHLGRDRSIDRLADSLVPDRERDLLPRIVLHAPRADARRIDNLIERHPLIVEAAPTVVPQDVPALLTDSDALVFAEASDPAIYRFTRLSVSTKVPEYLAARRPVIAIGPEGQSSIRALMRGPATWHADPDDADGIARATRSAIEASRHPIAEISSQLQATFDSAKTRERLRAALGHATHSKAD